MRMQALTISEKLPLKYRLGEVANYRDSIFKERAVVTERIRMAMGFNVRSSKEYTTITDGMEDLNMKNAFRDAAC